MGSSLPVLRSPMRRSLLAIAVAFALVLAALVVNGDIPSVVGSWSPYMVVAFVAASALASSITCTEIARAVAPTLSSLDARSHLRIVGAIFLGMFIAQLIGVFVALSGLSQNAA